jgi:dihydroorotase-like cyclic amidohydrolase
MDDLRAMRFLVHAGVPLHGGEGAAARNAERHEDRSSVPPTQLLENGSEAGHRDLAIERDNGSELHDVAVPVALSVDAVELFHHVAGGSDSVRSAHADFPLD